VAAGFGASREGREGGEGGKIYSRIEIPSPTSRALRKT